MASKCVAHIVERDGTTDVDVRDATECPLLTCFRYTSGTFAVCDRRACKGCPSAEDRAHLIDPIPRYRRVRRDGYTWVETSNVCGNSVTVIFPGGHRAVAFCAYPRGHAANLEHVFATHSGGTRATNAPINAPYDGPRVSWVDGQLVVDLSGSGS